MPPVNVPEIIVTLSDDFNSRSVQFSEMYELKDKITSVMLLWDYNSYYANIEKGYFIINGGKRVQPTAITQMEERRLEYARRNRMDVSVDGDNYNNGEINSSYMIGVCGKINSEEKTILLHISGDGAMWTWKDSR